MKLILGISAYYHDSAATLIENGEIIAAAQEERFSRIKHDSNFPHKAINFILKYKGISINDLDAIVFYEKPFLHFERLLETYVANAPFGFKSFKTSIPMWVKFKLFQKNNIFKELKKFSKTIELSKIKFSDHHLSHAASAYYPSPFQEAVILTIDGVGEWTTTSVSIGKGNKIENIKNIKYPHSLGLLYSAFTYYLGFKVNSGEYKVMGLAPYGKPKYSEIIFNNLIDIKNDGSFKLNQKFFSYSTSLKMINNNFIKLFGKNERSKNEDITQFHMDIAASIQDVLENVILKITKYLSSKYKIENLCLAGGVALNCVANSKILKNKYFKKIWIQPASGDSGCSLGAALAYYYSENNSAKKLSIDIMKGSFLGPKYKKNEIEAELIDTGAVFKEMDEESILDQTSLILKQGKSVGWFQGRMEFGPRALGARSIIADPRSVNMQRNLNLKIKFRESFRPFAPSILHDKVNNWFKLNEKSPYMLLVSEIRDEIKINAEVDDKNLFGIDKLNVVRSKIPAVTHVDFSARLQTVHPETNLKFFKLLQHFYKLTNCPILVNTSFNIRGEPIVCSPKDAFKCFMGTNLDALVIENFILFKDNQKINFDKNFRDNFELD